MQTEQPAPAKTHTGEGMGLFDDLAGRRWQIRINVLAVRQLRTDHSLDDMKILDREGNPFAKLADDPMRLCDVLWSLIASQAGEAGVSELDWLAAMGGDALANAAYALMEATIDFFPKHRRAPLQAMLRKMRTAEAELTSRMTTLAESATIDQAIGDQMDKAELEATRRLREVLSEPGN
jgi:hypothetical protein